MSRLLIVKGADEGKQFELAGRLMTVGRDAHSEIRLHDTEASRRHAEFAASDKGYTLRDIGSANGTFVNNKRIDGDVLLQGGDRIQIGQTLLVYSAGPGQEPPGRSNLSDQIRMISRNELELSSAIIKTVDEGEGSHILTHPDHAKSPWLRTALANLKIMYEASQAVSHILDPDELLSRILELIFRSIAADRGCIMLRNQDTGKFEPKSLRWREPKSGQQKMAVSRTIIDHVNREKQGVLISDAARDDRFSSGKSIIEFGIREVICVPMRGRHETLGVLYLDTQSNVRELAARDTSLGKFTEDHLALAIAMAHQAALAIEDSRYHHALVQAERLAAIGQTITNLSHSLKNILQGLRSGSEILEMGMGELSKSDLPESSVSLLQQGWNIVERNQGKIYELVMDMLNYSKERTPALELTNVNDVVQDVFDLLNGRAKEKNINLQIDTDDSIPKIELDPAGINHALLNIAGNALDAVEGCEAAKVIVGTRPDPDPDWLRIVVRDNGPGIPADKMDDIFKPFVSTKGAKGTGLGLPVSRKILREHGGDIIVESQPGKGTRFTLRLPVHSPLDPEMTGHTFEGTLIPPGDDDE